MLSLLQLIIVMVIIIIMINYNLMLNLFWHALRKCALSCRDRKLVQQCIVYFVIAVISVISGFDTETRLMTPFIVMTHSPRLHAAEN